MRFKANDESRRGLSLMEVLFAIGVLTIGILCIATVLPIGTKNAAGAIRTDISTVAVENQISNALARFDGKPEFVNIPIPSQQGFNTGIVPVSGLATETGSVAGSQRFIEVSVANAAGALPTDDVAIPGPGDAPIAPPAFCVDPAFIAAANNLRNDIAAPGARSLNHYDRTKFPCYDFNYNPMVAPGRQMTLTAATLWPITPRMLRVSITPRSTLAPTDRIARVLLSERDGLPLTKTKDKTQPPGLFFREIGGVGQVDVERNGAFSSIVTFVPTSSSAINYDISVVVFEARQVTRFDTVALTESFQLAPFTAAENAVVAPLKNNTNIDPPTYGEEVMGVVTDTVGLIENGIGIFEYTHSSSCDPQTKVGQWVMLARFDPALSINRYAWYRISDIIQGPTLVGATYVTRLEVRGQDWLYHPEMIDPATGTLWAVKPWGTPADYPPLDTLLRQRNATYVVKCPRVVHVRSLTL